MKARHLLFGLIALGTVFLGCGGANWTESYYFDPGWPLRDSIQISALPGPEAQLVIGLELDAETYPYRNIWLKLQGTDRDGQPMEQMLQDTLMDEMGNWSQAHAGQTVRWEITATPRFHDSFSLIQFMREETLLGVKAVHYRWQ